MILYHRVGPGGEDSAAVREYLVKADLAVEVEFCNVEYEVHRNGLRAATGGDVVPTLIVNGQSPKIGKEAILKFLESI